MEERDVQGETNVSRPTPTKDEDKSRGLTDLSDALAVVSDHLPRLATKHGYSRPGGNA